MATAAPDHWEVLGLAPGADAASLKRAFRQQARRWHPDLNGNDPVAEDRFKRVNEAYAVLSDPIRRRAWEAGEGLDSAGGDVDPFASGFPRFEDYLEHLFGQGRERPPAWEDELQAEDPHRETWEDAPELGDSHPTGGGVATTPDSPPPVVAATDEETLVTLTPEQALAGHRLELELGDGTLVEVWTPPLAGDGWRLRLAGVAPGGGDHFLHLRVRTAEGLRIDGLRVLYQLDLHPADAALGCQVVVPTLDGPGAAPSASGVLQRPAAAPAAARPIPGGTAGRSAGGGADRRSRPSDGSGGGPVPSPAGAGPGAERRRQRWVRAHGRDSPSGFV